MLTLTLELAEKLAFFLSREERIKLFEELLNTLPRWSAPSIAGLIGIKKTHIYRYLPKSKSSVGGLAPNNKTTAKIIMALIDRGRLTLVLDHLDKAARDMEETLKQYRRIPRLKKKY
ncbi:MAG: hypothetical protein QXG39_05575 [Candidatus Aenigmatarchaeota archaeon]